MDFVISGGTDPEQPVPAPKQRDPIRVLLQVIAVGVFLVAAGVAYVGWTVHESQQDSRMINCSFLTDRSGASLTQVEKELIDQLDCDVPGR
jgi:hypothetical protein